MLNSDSAPLDYGYIMHDLQAAFSRYKVEVHARICPDMFEMKAFQAFQEYIFDFIHVCYSKSTCSSFGPTLTNSLLLKKHRELSVNEIFPFYHVYQ